MQMVITNSFIFQDAHVKFVKHTDLVSFGPSLDLFISSIHILISDRFLI